jgi:transposase
MYGMIPPIYVRELTKEEQKQLQEGLRTKEAIVMRRCQIVMASAKRQIAPEIAENLSCSVGQVRYVIKRFNDQGVKSLGKRSCRPKKTRLVMDEKRWEEVREILHHSPYEYGKKRSSWTLKLAAEVCFEKAITETELSSESMRNALKRLGVGWKRAKHWITSPDPLYEVKKSREHE